MENLERQLEELEALQLVFGDSASKARLEVTTPRALERAKLEALTASGDASLGAEDLVVKVELEGMALFVTMPPAYPAQARLQLSVSAGSEAESHKLVAVARAAVEEAGEGCESALAAIQAFVDEAEDRAAGAEAAARAEAEVAAERERERAAGAAGAGNEALRLSGPGAGWLDVPPEALERCGLPAWSRVWRGEELHDRKSVFQAFAVRAASESDTASLVRLLLRDRRVRRATHNMMAYRVTREADGVTASDNDEDGEAGAGARMSHLLELMGATAAAVVVSRWYGGVLLGPKRFAHISNCTREALEQSGICPRE